MKICFLTQTATDVSAFYKEFFKDQDLFFLTFKSVNDQAVAHLPKSSWSEGRNRLWEEVRGKYDYYVFLDDDLSFWKPRLPLPPYGLHLLQKMQSWFGRGALNFCYTRAEPHHFFKRLEHYLSTYSPEVLSVIKFHVPSIVFDEAALKSNSFVRRLGYFDAEFTVLSNLAASKMLPYDTKISGWWSAQLPIYIYAHDVFASKAICVTELATSNHVQNTGYVPGYVGLDDCKKMLAEMTTATGRDFNAMFNDHTVVDVMYGRDEILHQIPKPDDKEDYKRNFDEAGLNGLENFLHPHLKF